MCKKNPNIEKFYFKEEKISNYGYSFMFYRDIGEHFDFSTFNPNLMNNLITLEEMDKF